MKSKNRECCFMPMAQDPKESGSDKYCSYRSILERQGELV